RLLYTSLSFSLLLRSILYTLSLHDALPIYSFRPSTIPTILSWTFRASITLRRRMDFVLLRAWLMHWPYSCKQLKARGSHQVFHRSEEHTSELQSRFDLVCRLLLEKKKMHK